MLLLIRSVASAIVDELCSALALMIYITSRAGMLRIANLELWLVLHELVLLG